MDFPDMLGVSTREYFSQYGGTALGLKLAFEAARLFPSIKTPAFVVIEMNRFRNANRCDIIHDLNPLMDREVVIRCSGPNEAFSPRQVRGANNPFRGQRFQVHAEMDLEAVLDLAAESSEECFAFVFQEVDANPSLGAIYTEWDGTKTSVEFRLDQETYYFEAKAGKILYGETTRHDRNTNYIHALADLSSLLEIHSQLEQCLGGNPFSTEILFDNRQMTVLQLRSQLQDSPRDLAFTSRRKEWEREYEKHGQTRFVWGAFDHSGPVISANQLEKHPDPASAGPCLVLVDQRPIWENPQVKQLLESEHDVVFLDTEQGFSLSHPHELLPPCGANRERFKYISLPWLRSENLLGKTVRVVSDGREGILLEPHMSCGGKEPGSDRKRTDLTPAKHGKVTFALLPPGEVPNFSQVTSVGVIAFTPDGKHLVTTLQFRGVDLPGGHAQVRDNSFEDVARRETLEEAQVELERIEFLEAWSSDYYGTEPDQLTYLVVVAAIVGKVHPFVPNLSHSRRLFLTPEQFRLLYSAGDRDRMASTVTAAHAFLFSGNRW